LWQFPGTTRFDAANFGAFLELLPAPIDGRKLRHVLEVQHESFGAPEFTALLKRSVAALAFDDDAKRPAFQMATAALTYARLRGQGYRRLGQALLGQRWRGQGLLRLFHQRRQGARAGGGNGYAGTLGALKRAPFFATKPLEGRASPHRTRRRG